MICPNCQAQNSSGAKWCGNCGQQLQNAMPLPGVASPGPALPMPQATSPLSGCGVLRFTNGAEFTVQGAAAIGRDNACDIVLGEQSVSRMHARITLDGSGKAMLVDLGSTAGTLVNGVRISPHQPVSLAPGAHIQFGAVSATYTPAFAPPPIAPIHAGDASGRILNIDYSQQAMPDGPGKWLAVVSMVVFVLMGLFTILIVTAAASICGCGLMPLLIGMGYGGFMLLKRTVLGKDQFEQVAFSVQDPLGIQVTPVVLFADKGGFTRLADGDEVVVHGDLQVSQTLLARRVEVHSRNGVPLMPKAVIEGKQPISMADGMKWLLLSLSPLLLLLLFSLSLTMNVRLP